MTALKHPLFQITIALFVAGNALLFGCRAELGAIEDPSSGSQESGLPGGDPSLEKSVHRGGIASIVIRDITRGQAGARDFRLADHAVLGEDGKPLQDVFEVSGLRTLNSAEKENPGLRFPDRAGSSGGVPCLAALEVTFARPSSPGNMAITGASFIVEMDPDARGQRPELPLIAAGMFERQQNGAWVRSEMQWIVSAQHRYATTMSSAWTEDFRFCLLDHPKNSAQLLDKAFRIRVRESIFEDRIWKGNGNP